MQNVNNSLAFRVSKLSILCTVDQFPHKSHEDAHLLTCMYWARLRHLMWALAMILSPASCQMWNSCTARIPSTVAISFCCRESTCAADTVNIQVPQYINIHLARLEMRLSVFCQLLSLRCVNFKNLCAHHQKEVLRIPKYPQLARFAWF